jgi:hypothetical protein
MSGDTRFDVVEQLVPELEAKGYEVFVHPKKPLVPTFLGDFSPDVLAKRPGKNLVIEVVRQSDESALKLNRLRALFENQPGWELRVVWIMPNSQPKAIEAQDPATVRMRLSEIKELASGGHTEPAFLLAWATFEALARAVYGQEPARPKSPGLIVQELALDGHLTPSEADLAMILKDKRNGLVHGDLRMKVSVDELAQFLSILEIMLGEVETPEAGSPSQEC